jgi:hypothetical protein
MANPSPFEVIGVGWAFPPRFDPVRGTVDMTEGEEEIVGSLRILFGTQLGERILLPEYGSELSAEVFRNATLSERTVLESRLRRAILHFESRIRVEALEVDAVDLNEGILRIRVEYVIVATNSRSNRVFPFYKTEGTLIPAR